MNILRRAICLSKISLKIDECALEANVKFIITGDKDLLVLDNYKNIKIINPKEYFSNVTLA